MCLWPKKFRLKQVLEQSWKQLMRREWMNLDQLWKLKREIEGARNLCQNHQWYSNKSRKQKANTNGSNWWCSHRDLSMHIERVLWVTFWRPFMYRPKMGIVKTWKLIVRPKIILFSKTVLDYGNRSADICLVMQAVGQAGHSLSMQLLRSLWMQPAK